MKVLILGGDGYLGWPTAMHFAARGHDVHVMDNYLRRRIAKESNSQPLLPTPNLEDRAKIFDAITGHDIAVTIGDCCDFPTLETVVSNMQPDTIIHYAEQPSAPYSMMGYDQARLTMDNNLNATFNLIWAVMENAPDCHIVKLGTMGEYGTPNIDIEEGWLEIEHKGRKDKVLFPRAAGSLYHTTKILDTDLLWFYVRTYGLRVTDLMQGPVYGIHTQESVLDERLFPNFHYDDIFGTVLNRFMVQAVSGLPLSVYGSGGQTRGYLNLLDTLQCVELAANSPVEKGNLRIFNQFTEVFSVNQLAARVQRVGKAMGLDVEVSHIENPRKESEEHYYNVVSTGLCELGLKPHLLTDDGLEEMLRTVMEHRDSIDTGKIMPRVRWDKK
jgi:UDP-sulfoquinovose synthase